MEGKIFVSSDTHFAHDRRFLYGARGFNSVHEMDEAIVENWNSVVGAEDQVYLLGDVMLNDNEEGLRLLKSLNGHLHIVRGNHDTDNRVLEYFNCENVEEVQDQIKLIYKKVRILLTHYPTLVGNFDDGRSLHHGLLNLCGHSHTTDPFADWNERGRIFHVELDAHNLYPVELDKILEMCRERIERGE